MTSTLIPTCSFCGLRFSSRPLLELHVREDHAQRHRAQAGQGDQAARRPARPDTGNPVSGHGQPASPVRTGEQAATAGSPSGRRQPAGRAKRTPRRVIGMFRHPKEEILLAAELLFRPRSAPPAQSPEERPGGQDTHPTATSGRVS